MQLATYENISISISKFFLHLLKYANIESITLLTCVNNIPQQVIKFNLWGFL